MISTDTIEQIKISGNSTAPDTKKYSKVINQFHTNQMSTKSIDFTHINDTHGNELLPLIIYSINSFVREKNENIKIFNARKEILASDYKKILKYIKGLNNR